MSNASRDPSGDFAGFVDTYCSVVASSADAGSDSNSSQCQRSIESAPKQLLDSPISHETLRAFYEIDSVGDLGSLCVESIDPSDSRLPAWARSLLPPSIHEFFVGQLRHVAMALRAIRQPGSEFTLFLDSTAWCSHAGLLLSCFRRGKLMHLSMYDQQLASESFFRRLSLWLFQQSIKLRKSRVVLFESDDDHVDSKLRFDANHKIIVPMPRSNTFPIEDVSRWNTTSRKPLRIGVGGIIRSGKRTLDSDFLRTINDSCKQSPLDIELVAGFPRYQADTQILPGHIKFVDTSDYAAYVGFIRSLDVLIVNLRRADYWFRTSGVVQDALSAGVFTVVNDYPVVRSQVQNPVIVGAVYSDLNDLAGVLANLPMLPRPVLAQRFETWNRLRSPEYISRVIESAYLPTTAPVRSAG